MDDRERTYLSRDERRAQLVAVGFRLFSTLPFDAVSIELLAGEAGVSKGLLYHYFGGKRELYVAVVRFAAAQLLVALRPDPSRPGVENAEAGLRAYLAFVGGHGDAFLALFSGGPGADPEVQAVLESTREALATQILTAARFDAAEPVFRMAARAWLGAVEAASVDWLRHRDLDEDALVEVLNAGLFVTLLAAARRAPGAASHPLLEGLPLLAGLTRR